MSPVPRAVLTATASTVLAVGAASLVAPEWLGLAGTRPWLYAASMRVPVVAGLGAVAAVAGIAAAARRRTWGRALRPAAAVLAVAAAAGGAVVLSRGAGAGHLPPAQEGDVTVVTANTLFSRADRAAVVDLVLRSGADVVTMPETTRAYAEDVAAGVLAAGGPALQVFAHQEGSANNSSTALLVSDRWGPYRQLPREELVMELGAVAAVPVSGDGPPVAAVHPHAPVGGSLRVWEAEGRAAVAWCAARPGALVGGDFNATLDHPGLADLGVCTDVSAATGTGARGTWHAGYPALLGAPIDHVLVDSRRWRPVASEVVDVPGSDHRAVLARVRPA